MALGKSGDTKYAHLGAGDVTLECSDRELLIKGTRSSQLRSSIYEEHDYYKRKVIKHSSFLHV